MKYWHYLFFVDLFCLSITSDLNNVIKYHVQTNERIRLECGLKSKSDTEDVNIPFFSFTKKKTLNFIFLICIDNLDAYSSAIQSRYFNLS